MIDGIGIDVVDIARFAESLERTPSLREKLFTPAEATKPIHSLAARFAAKEALAKALNAGHGLSWHEAEVINHESGKPDFFKPFLQSRIFPGSNHAVDNMIRNFLTRSAH